MVGLAEAVECAGQCGLGFGLAGWILGLYERGHRRVLGLCDGGNGRVLGPRAQRSTQPPEQAGALRLVSRLGAGA